MADLYTSLNVSPKKKRARSPSPDDEELTPKRLRILPPTPPSTVKRTTRRTKAQQPTPLAELPAHLSRLHTIHTALQNALSHALATCAVSPSSDTGVVANVLNHFSLATYAGLTSRFDVDDLRRLCWLWEWDGKELPKDKGKKKAVNDEENPFLESAPVKSPPKEWSRGAMGFVINATSHYSKSAGKRVSAYGIGIEVEMDIDKEMGGGMAAVARWTAAGETRRQQVRTKLEKWLELHPNTTPVPELPLADLPPLSTAQAPSTLTRLLASASPKSPSSISILKAPPSPSRVSPTKSSSKQMSSLKPFTLSFPLTPSSSPAKPAPVSPVKTALAGKSSILFPQTPSSRQSRSELAKSIFGLRTPSSSPTRDGSSDRSLPSTPVHQKGAAAATVPETPTSSRRQALMERVRQKSVTNSPTKSASAEVKGGKLTKDQMLKLSQDEVRRRCLLGRLGGVAESVWMLFSSPAGSSTMTPTMRKRRMMPVTSVAQAVIKSSPVPISLAEAQESLELLTSLCPFFIRPVTVTGEDWLEMPAPTATTIDPSPDTSSVEATPTKPKSKGKTSAVPSSPSRPVPPSPSRVRSKDDSAKELLTRSPRRVRSEGGGLREVRERIRRELELQD